jgi:hypothetical protein
MADLDVTKKLSIYHLLYRINLSFANIVRRCRELEEARVFRPKYLRRFQGFAQELQAEINSDLAGDIARPRTRRLEPLRQGSPGVGEMAARSRRRLHRRRTSPPRTAPAG